MSESAVNRRDWPRIPAASLTDVRVSLVAGPDVKLVNLSRGGALLEVGARYAMRAYVRLKLTRTTGETTVVPGTVSWSRVGTIAGGRINYLSAVIFEQPIGDFTAATGYQLDNREAAELSAEASAPATPAPALEVCGLPEPRAARLAEVAVDESQLQLAAADARAESLRHELDAATTDVANLTLTNDTLAAQLDAASNELRALREELEAAERRSAEEQSRLALAQSEAAGEQSRLAGELAAAAARTAALQTALDARDVEHAHTLDDQRTRFEARIEELARTISAHQEDAGHLLAARESWDAERTILLEQTADAVAAADAVRAELNAREQAHVRALDEHRVGFEAHVQELTETIHRQQAEHAQLASERESWDAERATLIEQMGHAAVAAEALRAAVDAREQEHARLLHEERTRFEAHVQELTETVHRHQAEHAQLAAERENWGAERAALLEQMVGAVARADALQATLEAREQDHARAIDEQQDRFEVRIQELTDALHRQEADHAQLAAEHGRWSAERSTLVEQLADAVLKADAVQTTLGAREREHAETIAAEQARYDTLVAELIQASNDQHTEYQDVLAEHIAAREEERARADRTEAALFRERAAAERERADVESRTRELEARLDALEALCAAHETRYRTLRRDAERLVTVLAAPVTAAAPDQEELASFPVHAETEQTVA